MTHIELSAIHTLQDTVLSRYDTHARVLPWRLTEDPYKIWISETMSCQTQISRVISYYDRRFQVLPDIQTLAHINRQILLQTRS